MLPRIILAANELRRVIQQMEFVPLRSLQRGRPEVWESLNAENGRIVLTNKGQPAYLLVDLAGQNVVSLINWIDHYRNSEEEPHVNPPATFKRGGYGTQHG
jgi:hypothetical protein